MSKAIIQFNETFYKKLKNLKSFIKPYFLDVHKGILISVLKNNKEKVKCELNFGRYILQFVETVEKLEGFEDDFSICLSIEELEKYGKLDTSIKLVIKDREAFVRANGFSLPLKKQAEKPNMEDLPYIEKVPFSQESTDTFTNLYKSCCQKENLLTLNEEIIYEKISDYLYRIEENSTDMRYSIAFDDLKMINLIFGNRAISYNNAPKYHVLADMTHTLHILKYKNDTINKNVYIKKKNLRKDSVTNVIIIETKDLKRVIDTLSVTNAKVFGLILGSDSCVCVDGKGYRVNAEVKLNVTNQEFLLDKKEMSILLKFCTDPTITILAGKDFMVINKKFVVLMRSIVVNEE